MFEWPPLGGGPHRIGVAPKDGSLESLADAIVVHDEMCFLFGGLVDITTREVTGTLTGCRVRLFNDADEMDLVGGCAPDRDAPGTANSER